MFILVIGDLFLEAISCFSLYLFYQKIKKDAVSIRAKPV
jgi:hypothetical protein